MVFLSVVIILFLSSVVEVGVKVKHLAPGKVNLINMAVHLLPHIHEMFTTHSVI
jgi:hypothetical protein